MSDLRKQLQAIRDEYRGEKYPGDLASEILSPPRRLPVGKLAAAATLITALAAAVALWVSLEPAAVVPPAPPGPPVEIATTPDAAGDDALATAVAVNEMGAMPAFPDDLPLMPDALPLVPEGESITDIGSMPEMPSLDLSFSFDT